jgi:uncharacterized cupin superfamily protein
MKDIARVFDEEAAEYVPYALKDGTPAGEIALLRKRDHENKTLFVGFYRCDHVVEGVEEYEVNDSMYILAGEVHVTAADGTEFHLKPGDAATFRCGERVTYRQEAGFKKFFVQSI